MKLVWHAENLLEVDWLRGVFGDLVKTETTDLGLECFDDNSIHVVSSNWKPLRMYEEYFRKCRALCKRLILFHASDEYYSGGYSVYRHFDLVIRNFATYLAKGNGILTIPEGYPNATRVGSPVRPADERHYAWSFTGEIKASRADMAAAFDGLEPQLVNRTASISDLSANKLSKAEFDTILEDTVFSPCPMGNVILETWRLYESLELGCIPLVERRVTLDYFSDLFGPHPIPAFHSWAAARRYADATLPDGAALLQLQAEIVGWWRQHKEKVRAEVREAVEGPSHTEQLANYAALVRNRHSMVQESLRLIELLRHQSAPSLRRRLARPAGPLRRIASESLHHLRRDSRV
jgi:hypothetical protein